MTCLICRSGRTRDGKATVTLERDGLTLVVRSVPARICENCGEEYVLDEAASRLLELAREAARAGVKAEAPRRCSGP